MQRLRQQAALDALALKPSLAEQMLLSSIRRQYSVYNSNNNTNDDKKKNHRHCNVSKESFKKESTHTASGRNIVTRACSSFVLYTNTDYIRSYCNNFLILLVCLCYFFYFFFILAPSIWFNAILRHFSYGYSHSLV